jgi:hypothetical protein
VTDSDTVEMVDQAYVQCSKQVTDGPGRPDTYTCPQTDLSCNDKQKRVEIEKTAPSINGYYTAPNGNKMHSYPQHLVNAAEISSTRILSNTGPLQAPLSDGYRK